jgi:hypothetical protein
MVSTYASNLLNDNSKIEILDQAMVSTILRYSHTREEFNCLESKWYDLLNKRRAKRLDAISFYLFPMLIGSSVRHWTLVVADTKDKMFYIVDSLRV